jgi:hypothetical protein
VANGSIFNPASVDLRCLLLFFGGRAHEGDGEEILWCGGVRTLFNQPLIVSSCFC